LRGGSRSRIFGGGALTGGFPGAFGGSSTGGSAGGGGGSGGASGSLTGGLLGQSGGSFSGGLSCNMFVITESILVLQLNIQKNSFSHFFPVLCYRFLTFLSLQWNSW
jgi:hypothetical protein